MKTSREMQTILHFWNGLGAALPTLAALSPQGTGVSIVDENVEEIDFDFPCDIVGITAMTQQATRAYQIADEFRSRGRYVAMGGIHSTVLPGEAALHADSVFVGQAENTWPQFLKDYDRGHPRSQYAESDFPEVMLSSIPTPRYDLLASHNYPVVWLQTSRGCPYDCEFCVVSKVYGRSLKYKTVDQVVNEINHVRQIWKRAQIGFADDNMFVSTDHAKKLLEALGELNFSWYAQSDISIARKPDILQLLHKSGCRILLVGLESVSLENVSALGNPLKQRMFSEYAECIQKIQENGIGVFGSFILGLDSDDLSTVDETIRFIKETHLMGVQVTLLTPLPGSALRNRLKTSHRVRHDDWRFYTGWNAVIDHPNFSTSDLEGSLLKIYKEVYNLESSRERASHFKKVLSSLVDTQGEAGRYGTTR
jgi:radical SAM superfamily enzyme YgiQ (UPF0313 family)